MAKKEREKRLEIKLKSSPVITIIRYYLKLVNLEVSGIDEFRNMMENTRRNSKW